MNHVEIKTLGMIRLLLLSEPRQTEYVASMKSSNSQFTKYCHPHLKEEVQIRATGSRDHTERKVCSGVRAVINTVTSR